MTEVPADGAGPTLQATLPPIVAVPTPWYPVGTNEPLVLGRDPVEDGRMKKRLVAGVLWFYAGWAFGAMVAFAFGVPSLVSPLLAIAAAALIAGDPRGVIWRRVPGSTARQARSA